MFFNLYKKIGKEVGTSLLNLFKRGLHNTKYNDEFSKKFVCPPNLFKDIYISGFIQQFIGMNLDHIHDVEKQWLKYDIGVYVGAVYNKLKLSPSEQKLYQNILIDDEVKKNWSADGQYDLGREHARINFCAVLNKFDKNEQNSSYLKAKHIAENTPVILDNTTYESKLAAVLSEITIYDYLQKQFGGKNIGKYDNVKTTNVENELKTNSNKSEDYNNSINDEKIEDEQYQSEKLLTEIFYYHRTMIIRAKNLTRQNLNNKKLKDYLIELLFNKSEKLLELFENLEKLKNEDYIYHLKEILLLEETITKVSQQKIYDVIKNADLLDKLEKNYLIKELIFKNFDKLNKRKKD